MTINQKVKKIVRKLIFKIVQLFNFIIFLVKSDITPRKKKRSLKVSEPESHQKRRRHQRPAINVRGNLQGNGKINFLFFKIH